MSRSAINNSWAKDLKDSLNARKATKGKMKSDSSESSRENSSSRKRVKRNEKTDSDVKQSKPKKPIELETDLLILQRRQKQIDYGKNTVGYYNYLQKVPVHKRTKEDPRTPDKYSKYSRRSWDTLIKMWRKKLHEYDTGAAGSSDAASNPDSKQGDDEDGDEEEDGDVEEDGDEEEDGN